MCNIYMDSCKVCGCDIPMHLGDFATKKREIECYCGNHIPDKDVTVYVLTEDDNVYCKETKFGIRFLTENAKKNSNINFPNVDTGFKIEEL